MYLSKSLTVKNWKNYFHFFFHSWSLTVPCFSSTLVSSLKLAALLLFASGTSWKSLQLPTRASRLWICVIGNQWQAVGDKWRVVYWREKWGDSNQWTDKLLKWTEVERQTVSYAPKTETKNREFSFSETFGMRKLRKQSMPFFSVFSFRNFPKIKLTGFWFQFCVRNGLRSDKNKILKAKRDDDCN